jgi:MFS family permease
MKVKRTSRQAERADPQSGAMTIPRLFSYIRSALQLLVYVLFAFALGVGINLLDPPLLNQRLLDLSPQSKNTLLGFTTAAGLAIATLTQPIIGSISDRTRSALGRRIPYFIGGTGIVICCLFAVALAPMLGLVLIAYLLYQFGSNTIQGPWQALIPDQVPLEQRGISSGLKSMLEVLAVIVGRWVGGILISEGKSALAAALASGIFLVILLLTIVFAREPPSTTKVLRGPSIRSAIRKAFAIDFRTHRAFFWWFINRALFWGGIIALNTFLINYLIDVFNLADGEAQRFFADFVLVFGVIVVPIALLAGWISDRIGRRPLIALAGILAVIGSVLFLVLKEPNQLLIVAGFIGVGGGVFVSANWALLTDIIPSTEAARYMGIANIATASGSFAARLAGGALIDQLNRFTGSNTFGYNFMLYLTVLAFFLSVLAIWRVRENKSASSSPSVST